MWPLSRRNRHLAGQRRRGGYRWVIGRTIHRRTPALTLAATLVAFTVGCGSIQGEAVVRVPDSLGSASADGSQAAAPTLQPEVVDDVPPSDTAAQADSAGGTEPSDHGNETNGAVPPPDWLGQRTLPTDSAGVVAARTTPPELDERRFITLDTLPAPPDDAFVSSVEPLAGDPLARSTWVEGCPVPVADLRYVTAGFWGFDGRPHRGELILHHEVADDIVSVLADLYQARFPIEEMRVVTQADLDADPTGDGNNTASFVCRPVVGGSRFSEHAHGLAIDLNPFQNPYVKGDLVLPELATSYLDRDRLRAGMVMDGDVAVEAFAQVGWGWGGRWSSLKDYQHFALNNR